MEVLNMLMLLEFVVYMNPCDNSVDRGEVFVPSVATVVQPASASVEHSSAALEV
jgi:hypothetical protein